MCPAAPTACVAAAEHVPKELWVFLKCPDDTGPAWHSVTGMRKWIWKGWSIKTIMETRKK